MQDQFAQAEFFTNQCRVKGRILSGGRRLTDLLNDPRSSAVQLSRVQVMRIISPEKVIATHAFAVLEKNGIVFVLVKGEEIEAAESSFYKHVTTAQWDVFLTVPTFEVSGRLHVRGTGDLWTMLFERPGQFIPLTEAKAVYTLFPRITFAGEVIIVNKPYIEVACTDA